MECKIKKTIDSLKLTERFQVIRVCVYNVKIRVNKKYY